MASRRVRKKNKGSKKKFIFLSIASFLIVSVVGIYLLATSYVTRDYLTKEVERKFNCRFEIGDIDVSCLSPTATIELRDVRVAERDTFAKDKTDHDERPKLTSSVVDLGRLTVKVSVFDLLFRSLKIDSIEIADVKANGILYKDGSNNIEKLLVRLKEEGRAEVDTGATFNAKSNEEFLTNLKSIELSNVELNLEIEASGLLVQAKNIDFKLNKELELNIEDLGSLNPTDFDVAATIDLYSSRQEMHYGTLDLSGNLKGTIFNKLTADFDPNIELFLDLGEESHFKKIPVIQKVADTLLGARGIPLLNKITGKRWPETYFFKKGQNIHCSFNQHKLSFVTPLSVSAGDWGLTLEKDSWLDTSNNQHAFKYKLEASKGMSNTLNKVGSLLSLDKSKGDRLTLEFSSVGSLSKPKMKLLTRFDALKKAKDDALKKLEDKAKSKLLRLFE